MKFAKQKPEATVMDITPAMAKEMLETSWSLACQNIEDAAKAQEGLFSELEAA